MNPIGRVLAHSDLAIFVGSLALGVWLLDWGLALFIALVSTRLLGLLVRWGYTARRLGVQHLRNWRVIARINRLKATRGSYATAVALVASTLLFVSWVVALETGSFWAVGLATAFWFVSITNLGVMFLPPVALVLAVSRPESLAFHRDLKNTVHPLRVVSLLDIQEREISIRGRRVFSLPNLDSYDNLRIADPDRWKEIVDMLVSIVPIVVIDARERSSPVEEEARRMLDNDRYKAWALVNDDLSCPLLDSVAGGRSNVDRLGWKTCPRSVMLLMFKHIVHHPRGMELLEAHPGIHRNWLQDNE